MKSDRSQIIKEVVRAILSNAKPDRIWLFGSTATDEASETSDVDIAYNAPGFKETWKIDNEAQKIQPLLKIDVKNIAHAEARFKQRVHDTDRVLYSASKKLRAQDGLYNFTRALEALARICYGRKKLEAEGHGDLIIDLIVKRLQFTYEMAWNALKRYLDFLGIDAPYPRAVFKEAFAQKIINDEQIWLDMIEQRNATAHIYNEWEVRGILTKIDAYMQAFSRLKATLESHFTEE
jgi:nucleotidyltransferase substrate binding protein (TIGR01987 family)